jgi:predicted TPR repeat methyltransferase
MGDPEALSDGIRDALALDGNVDAIQRYYEDWADDYDNDVGAEQYDLPNEVARLLDQIVRQDTDEPIDRLTINPGPPNPTILDVGCGTGLIGVRLSEVGYQTIDGIDLSPAMTERAALRGCYNNLTSGVDITAPLPDQLVGAHDIVVVGGVFTVGHVPPSALAAVAAMVRPGGLLLMTTRKQYYDDTDYQIVSDQLEADGVLQTLRVNRDMPYTLDSTGHYWAHLVLGDGPGV